MQPLRVLSVALIALGLSSAPALGQVVEANFCPVPPCNFTVVEMATDATAEVEYASVIQVPTPAVMTEAVLSGMVITSLGLDAITFLEEDVLDEQGLPTGEMYGAFSIAGEPILTTWTAERVERLKNRIARIQDRLNGHVNKKRVAKLQGKYYKVEDRKHARLEKLAKKVEAAERRLKEHKNKKSRHSKNWKGRDREGYEDDDDEDDNKYKKSRHSKNWKKKYRKYVKHIKQLKKKHAKVEKRFNVKLRKMKKLIHRASKPVVLKKRQYRRLERRLERLQAKLDSIQLEMQPGEPRGITKGKATVVDVSPSGSVAFNDKGFGGTLPVEPRYKLTGQTEFSQFSFPNGPGEVTLGMSFFPSLDDGTPLPGDNGSERTVHTVPITVRFQ